MTAGNSHDSRLFDPLGDKYFFFFSSFSTQSIDCLSIGRIRTAKQVTIGSIKYRTLDTVILRKANRKSISVDRKRLRALYKYRFYIADKIIEVSILN